jgi:hypothetical protein
MDSAAAARTARIGERRKSPAEIEREAKLHGLALSRTRVLNDLHSALNPRYREQLAQALAFLDLQIAEVTAGPDT